MVNRNGMAAERARGLPLKAALAVIAAVLMAVMAFISPLPGIIRGSRPARTGAVMYDARADTEYIVKASDGKVAVFMPPGGEPVAVTDIDVATLRSHDIALLEGGVAVDTYEKLLRTLEDFGA
jgi:hypothetical protein